ncbi:unnamed protein product [Brachionus calyciflorus]|uniref:Tubulin alpha chain n=1 Tax=Brachionus calyciflorus TaxID=104777 RepID=A0A814AA15_9BILA|nr:unnamed protein product [Brachionus calyciflorus]
MTKKELICIHIGEAGCKIGNSFWDLLCNEYSINSNGSIEPSTSTTKVNNEIFFEQSSAGKYIPRSIMIDLDTDCINEIKIGKMKNIYDPDNYIAGSGQLKAKKIYSYAYYEQSKNVLSKIKNTIRECVDQCSNLEGFLITRSLGGGTGSGLSASVFQHLSETYSKKSRIDLCLYPKLDSNPYIEEIYNSVLTTNSENRACVSDKDLSIGFDNTILNKICNKNLEIKNPTMGNFNDIIGYFLSTLTNPIRHSGLLNTDIKSIIRNLVPFDKINYVVPSLVPILSQSKVNFKKLDTQILTNNLFNEENQLLTVDLNSGKYLSCYLSYQGPDFTLHNIDTAINKIQNSKSFNTTTYLTNGFKVALTSFAPITNEILPKTTNSALLLANSTSMSKIFQKLVDNFDEAAKGRKNFNKFVEYGMDEMELFEARETVQELIEKYRSLYDEPNNESAEEEIEEGGME